MLSTNRDLPAAKLFLLLALSATGGIRRRVVNVDGHPACARVLKVYCTGLGAVNPPLADGVASSLSTLSWSVNTLTATVGG